MCLQIAGGSILAVDDEPGIRRLLTKALMLEGYQCAESGSGEEALRLLTAREFDLLILDIRMPGKKGYEIVAELHLKYPHMPIIMASGVTDIDIIIQCMKDGAQDYVLKPFELNALKASVGRAMKTHRLEMELHDYQNNLELKVSEQTKRIRELFLDSIDALASALEAKDKYTAGHSRRVTAFSLLIAEMKRCSSSQLDPVTVDAFISIPIDTIRGMMKDFDSFTTRDIWNIGPLQFEESAVHA